MSIKLDKEETAPGAHVRGPMRLAERADREYRIEKARREAAYHEAATELIRQGEPVAYSQNDFIRRLDERTAELRELLREARAAMQEEYENREGHVAWTHSCPVCDGALPTEHSLICRLDTAIASKGGTL